ncbi:hypothetical protein TNCV_3310141 [Trichonephila clavipes]|nr:hypothetical protein TNCV_3310141 [Trichonephila clavipes]
MFDLSIRKDIIRIQICIAAQSRKRLRSELGGVVHKSIEGNSPALPQSFELSSTAKEYVESYPNTELVHMHLIYGLAEGNAQSAEKLYLKRYSQRDAPQRLMFANLNHNLFEYGSLRDYRHSEGGPRIPTGNSIQLILFRACKKNVFDTV